MKYIVRKVLSVYKDFEIEADSPQEAYENSPDYAGTIEVDCDGEFSDIKGQVLTIDGDEIAEFLNW